MLAEARDQRALRASLSTFSWLLQTPITQDLTAGKRVLDLIVKRGYERDSYLGSHLVRLFASCETLVEAHHVFIRLPAPNVFAWSAIISAHVKLGHPQKAIRLFTQLQQSSIRPDAHVFAAVLKACCAILKACCNHGGALTQGRYLHSQTIESGHESNVFISGVLIDMYINAGLVHDAYGVFNHLEKQDVVTCTSMIGGFVQHGYSLDAFCIFRAMQEQGIRPNQASFVSIMKACTSIAFLNLDMLLHANIVESGHESDVIVCNAVIDMYARCGRMEDAVKVFHRLPQRDAVSWCTIITGYVEHGKDLEAQILFQLMQQDCLQHDQALFVCALKLCSSRAALEQGKLVHSHIMEVHLASDILIGNTLVDMYMSCGSFVDASKVFFQLQKRNVVTWSTMIAGLAQHRQYSSIMECMEAMHQEGWKPNNVTYACLLSACRHKGLVMESFHHFKCMIESNCIAPTVVHFNCLVDLLGHAGRLNEAVDLLETMPFQQNIVGWTSLLSSCKAHRLVDLGRQCFDRIVTMEGEKSTGYVLMSSIYAHEGMLNEAEKIEELRRDEEAWNKPGMASIELKNVVHEFNVGDRSHPQSDEISMKLKSLHIGIKSEGYSPQV